MVVNGIPVPHVRPPSVHPPELENGHGDPPRRAGCPAWSTRRRGDVKASGEERNRPQEKAEAASGDRTLPTRFAFKKNARALFKNSRGAMFLSPRSNPSRLRAADRSPRSVVLLYTRNTTYRKATRTLVGHEGLTAFHRCDEAPECEWFRCSGDHQGVVEHHPGRAGHPGGPFLYRRRVGRRSSALHE